jgi:hypothetical protein
MKYQIVYHSGQGSGFHKADIISVKSRKLDNIVSEINMKSNLIASDLGFLSGNKDEITFGTRMDGITFETPVLVVKRIYK